MQVETVTRSYSLEDAHSRITSAIRTLYIHCPFWAVLLEKVQVVITDQVPTAGVDYNYEIIGFNADFMKSLSSSHLAFVLCHEVGHIAFDSSGRLRWRDKLKWNIASDYVINAMLHNSFGGSLPNEALYSRSYGSMSAEEVYESLPEGVVKETFIYLEGDSSGSDFGDDLDNTIKIATPDISDDDEKSDGDSAGKDSKTNWPAQITKALTHAKLCGSISDSLERQVRGLSASEVDWQTLLQQKVSQHLSRDNRDDFTYNPPNRRFLHQDIICASMIGHRPPAIAYSIDTSGSMCDEEIDQGVVELSAIRQLFNARMYSMSCDSEVNKAEWIEPYQPMPTPVGGGGTSFCPIFEHLKENRIEVDIVVVFTDGYGEFPQSTDYDTIWVITSTVIPPFGEYVSVRIPDRSR